VKIRLPNSFQELEKVAILGRKRLSIKCMVGRATASEFRPQNSPSFRARVPNRTGTHLVSHRLRRVSEPLSKTVTDKVHGGEGWGLRVQSPTVTFLVVHVRGLPVFGHSQQAHCLTEDPGAFLSY